MANCVISAGTYASVAAAAAANAFVPAGSGPGGVPTVNDTIHAQGTADLTIARSDNLDIGIDNSASYALQVTGATAHLRFDGPYKQRGAGLRRNASGNVHWSDTLGTGYDITLDTGAGTQTNYFINETTGGAGTIQGVGAGHLTRIKVKKIGSGTGACFSQATSADQSRWNFTYFDFIEIVATGTNVPKSCNFQHCRFLYATSGTFCVGGSISGTYSADTDFIVEYCDFRNCSFTYQNQLAKTAGTRSWRYNTISGGQILLLAPHIVGHHSVHNFITLDCYGNTTHEPYIYGHQWTRLIGIGARSGSSSGRVAFTPMQAGMKYSDSVICRYYDDSASPGTPLGLNDRGIVEQGGPRGRGDNEFNNSIIDGAACGSVSDFYLGIGDRMYDGIMAVNYWGNFSDAAGNFSGITAGTMAGILKKLKHCTMVANSASNFDMYGAIGVAEKVYSSNHIVEDIESNILVNCTQGVVLSTQATQNGLPNGQVWTRQGFLRVRGNFCWNFTRDGSIPNLAGGSSIMGKIASGSSLASGDPDGIFAALVHSTGTVVGRVGRTIEVASSAGLQGQDFFYKGNTMNANGTPPGGQAGWLIDSIPDATHVVLGSGLVGTTDAHLPSASDSFITVKGWRSDGLVYGSHADYGSTDRYEDPQLRNINLAMVKEWAKTVDATLVGQPNLTIYTRFVEEALKYNGTDINGNDATYNTAWDIDNLFTHFRYYLYPLNPNVWTAAASYDAEKPYAGAVAPAASGGSLTAGVAASGLLTQSTVQVGWTAPTGGTGPYTPVLEIGPAGVAAPTGGQWTTAYTGSAGAGSGLTTVTGRTASTLYAFRVRYTDSAAATVYSNVITAVTTAPPGAGSSGIYRKRSARSRSLSRSRGRR